MAVTYLYLDFSNNDSGMCSGAIRNRRRFGFFSTVIRKPVSMDGSLDMPRLILHNVSLFFLFSYVSSKEMYFSLFIYIK